MSAELDLDKLRAAREEAEGSGPKHVLFGGEKFEVPSEPPLEFAWALEANDSRTALRMLFGDEGFERFMGHRPSTLQLADIMEGLTDLYPDISGEGRKASGRSSSRTTAKPRPTSSGSTG